MKHAESSSSDELSEKYIQAIDPIEDPNSHKVLIDDDDQLKSTRRNVDNEITVKVYNFMLNIAFYFYSTLNDFVGL